MSARGKTLTAGGELQRAALSLDDAACRAIRTSKRGVEVTVEALILGQLATMLRTLGRNLENHHRQASRRPRLRRVA